MDLNVPSQATAFNTLPIEMNMEIAHYLTDHKDFANYSQICRATRDSIYGDNCSIWRANFRRDFAMTGGMTGEQLMQRYKHRWTWINMFVNKRLPFSDGHRQREKAVLKVVRDLINESFTGDASHGDDAPLQCHNMARLEDFTFDSIILLGGRRTFSTRRTHPLLLTVKVMLMHFLVSTHMCNFGGWYALDEAQKMIYAPTNEAPLYLEPNKETVNMEWVFHCMNFFRYYMRTMGASQLYYNLEHLEDDQRPSPWTKPLKSGSYPLKTHWKGTYSFLEPQTLLRFRAVSKNTDNDEVFTDLNIDEGNIQSMKFDFPADGASLLWPKPFEHRLHSRRYKKQVKAQQMKAQQAKPQYSPPKTSQAKNKNKTRSRSPRGPSSDIRFNGEGEDGDESFHISGWLNELPDQCGIPGWQRITFMKHFADDLNDVDRDNLWGYEGVVLPGGRIILGRWWYASESQTNFDNEYGGPFILWAVEPEPESAGDDE